jgi:hypothetical protein
MICTLTARRLKPGAYDSFRSAWDPAQASTEALGSWKQIYHCRDLGDPDVVVSFGLFDGNVEQLREAQARLGRELQLDRVAAHVEEVLLDGAYEVIEELRP